MIPEPCRILGVLMSPAVLAISWVTKDLLLLMDGSGGTTGEKPRALQGSAFGGK